MPRPWLTDNHTVVYMVPPERPNVYATLMKTLTKDAESELKLVPESIDLIGFVVSDSHAGGEGLVFLEEMGIDTRRLSLLVLWAEAAAAVKFEDRVSKECGFGLVILPATGVMLPTMRMPSVDTNWWLDPLHQAYAAMSYAGLLKNGRDEMTGDEPATSIAPTRMWN